MCSHAYDRTTPIRTAEILCVGTELLLGDIVNTNAAYLARGLAAMGVAVYHQAVVGDHPDRLREALNHAFMGHGRPAADLVILSGGLGPTYDDLTKETVADYFGRPMVLHEESLDRIRDFFAKTGRVMAPNNEKQAMMPAGAVVFANHYGTAPALAVGDATHTAILLPGPPCELEPLFCEQVVPFLGRYTDGVLLSRNIHLIGIGESDVEERLRGLMQTAVNPTVAPYCKSGEVRLRVTARADNEAAAAALCDGMVETIRGTSIAPYIYGIDCGNIETALIRVCTERGLTLATAESCTGGLIGERLTAIPGASAVYVGGCITYTNEQKIAMLGVDPASIAAHTEVSATVASEMASGVRRLTGADIGIATTGYAGPGGGTEENPVGTVYVGISTEHGTEAFRLYYHRRGNARQYVREAASTRAMRIALEGAMKSSPNQNIEF